MVESVSFNSILKELYPNQDVHYQSLSGGSIHSTYLIDSKPEKTVIKFNSSNHPGDMFPKEALGLNTLKNAFPFVPTPLKAEESYLQLEYIETGAVSAQGHQEFGVNLAKLHSHSADHFGFEDSNYIGSLPQQNEKRTSWDEFFITQRIEPQLKMAIDKGHFNNNISRQIDRLGDRVNQFFPVEKSSLLHGDLWSGNYLECSGGPIYIIDPAVYYGHRYMDLGMSLLFGGFSSEFYKGYDKEHPLEADWRKGAEMANLYPVLVHVNLFGGHYVLQFEKMLKEFL